MTDNDRLVVRFKFDDTTREYELDVFNLKQRERIEIEEFFDMPFSAAYREGWLLSSAKGITFLGYLARKRKEPEFTYDQAVEFEAESLPIDEDDDDLATCSRPVLNAMAADLGIKRPEKIRGGRKAVIAAIEAAQRPTETPQTTGTRS